MAEPGFSSSRSATLLDQRLVRVAEDDDLAVREARRHAGRPPGRRAGVVHHADADAVDLDHPRLRHHADQVQVVAVAEHALDRPVGLQLGQHGVAHEVAGVQDAVGPLALLQQASGQRAPAPRQVRVRHDRDADHAPSAVRTASASRITGTQLRDVVQPQHRDAGASRQRRRRRRAEQRVLGSPLASAVNSLCETAASTGKPSARTRSRSRSRVRSRRVDLPKPKPGSTRIGPLPHAGRDGPRRRRLEEPQHVVDGALVGAGRVRARAPPVVRDDEAGPAAGDHAGQRRGRARRCSR